MKINESDFRPPPEIDPDPAKHLRYEPLMFPGEVVCLMCSWLPTGFLVPWPCSFAAHPGTGEAQQ